MSIKMTKYFGNRCAGCKHFDGYKGNGSKHRGTPVNCGENVSANIGTGCSIFSPDSTARCSNCYYQTRTQNFYACQKGHSLSSKNDWNRSYCYDFYWKEEESELSKKGFCFISTAVCQAQNLPDDCFELQTLRGFRDHQLLNDNSLKELVFQYYEISPKLVHKVENDLYLSQYLFENHIKPIVKMINNNQKKYLIVEKYKQMVDFIEKY